MSDSGIAMIAAATTTTTVLAPTAVAAATIKKGVGGVCGKVYMKVCERRRVMMLRWCLSGYMKGCTEMKGCKDALK